MLPNFTVRSCIPPAYPLAALRRPFFPVSATFSRPLCAEMQASSVLRSPAAEVMTRTSGSRERRNSKCAQAGRCVTRGIG
jgi:hypothetical protein